MKTHSEQFLKKRKFLLILPLLTLPFITLTFYAMGGGQGLADTTTQPQQGINSQLPEAQLSGDQLDKMSMYSQSEKDSARIAQQSKDDPYGPDDTGVIEEEPVIGENQIPGYEKGINTRPDPNEIRVKQRLAQLEQSMAQGQANDRPYDNHSVTGRAAGSMSNDLDRLEQMMKSMSGNAGGDPEMQQLDGMLDKIMTIQNPELGQQKLKALSQANKGHVYAVTRPTENVDGSIVKRQADFAGRIRSVRGEGSQVFYGIDDQPAQEATSGDAIPAVIHKTATLVSGATVKMRLSEDIMINGMVIPRGVFVNGKCSIEGDRLIIEIPNLTFQNKVFPVALSVYDPDGLEGINIPGAISRDVAKDGADRALQNVQLMTLDPSMAAQAAGTGVEIAKSLFSRKAKLVRVTVKAGHPVLLVDKKSIDAQ